MVDPTGPAARLRADGTGVASPDRTHGREVGRARVALRDAVREDARGPVRAEPFRALLDGEPSETALPARVVGAE